MDIAKFLSLLSKKELWLARPNTFKDKREGIFHPAMKIELDKIYKHIKQKKELPSDIKNSDDYQLYLNNNSYINCWHKNTYENMVMWAMYGYTENSIAIKTTVEKLKNSFSLVDVMKFSLEVALDEVSYLKAENIPSEKNSRQPFFIKRPHFYFENEVRLYLKARETKSSDHSPLGYIIPVNLSELIDEIYIHPDSKIWFVEVIQDVVKKYNVTAPVKQGEAGNQL